MIKSIRGVHIEGFLGLNPLFKTKREEPKKRLIEWYIGILMSQYTFAYESRIDFKIINW